MTEPAVLPPTQPRRLKSLAARLVVVGVVQLVLLALTAVVIFIAEGPHGPGHPEELSPADIHALEAVTGDAQKLTRALDDLHDRRIEASVYDRDDQLVASNVDPPLAIPRHHRPFGPPPPGAFGREPPPGAPPPGERPGARPFPPPSPIGGPPRPGHRIVIPLRVDGTPGRLIARGTHGKPPGLTGPILVLVCGLSILIVGALFTARWIVRPIEQLTRTARALGAGDLSARSRLDRSDEIGELGVRVDEMADRIESLLVTEKELLANVAHELRTPLSRIGVALDLAGEGDAEAARAALAEISVDVAELEAIIDDILTAMRAEVAGSLPLRRSVVLPREIANASAARLRARHPQRPLSVAVAPDLPAIDVDTVLFRRVIDNLLENAHKYTPDATKRITLTVCGTPDRVAFEVGDRGIGISADDLPRVFTAFFRGDRSRSRETGGVGLGLTLAHRIVEAHGGSIAILSDVGDGTLVCVEIPAAKQTATPSTSA